MKNLTPNQKEGGAIEVVSEKVFGSEKEAHSFFIIVKRRLQQIDRWRDISGNVSASFALVNENGKLSHREPKIGDHLRIDIPGPGSKAGDGFDWVTIEEIVDVALSDEERYGFRVRPTSNPGTSDNQTAHFYSSASTSTFIVSRHGKIISTSVQDRNLKPNQAVRKLVDKVRDAVVGAVGILGFSKVQWKQLTDGLLHD